MLWDVKDSKLESSRDKKMDIEELNKITEKIIGGLCTAIGMILSYSHTKFSVAILLFD